MGVPLSDQPDDPHVHVDVKLHADVAARNLMASTFGLAADLPSTATTGCGLQVPYLMTSTDPDRVTCLPCREYAHQENLRRADEVERLGRAPGMDVDFGPKAIQAAKQYRDIARRFADPNDAPR